MTHSDGTIRFPAFDVPPSSYLSDTTRRILIDQLRAPGIALEAEVGIEESRRQFDSQLISPLLERMNALYSVSIEKTQIGGVGVYVVAPKDARRQPRNDHILINLHGGVFSYGSGMAQLVESIPIACACNLSVVSIDYRQGPEHTFPAASEDVASVYRELLEKHSAAHIGIYGCSAGANLTAMAMAWLRKEQLPLPGAIGMFCAGADAAWGGESRYLGLPLMGGPPPTPAPNPPPFPMSYLGNVDLRSPLVSPVFSPTLLAAFPDTLLISGTRSYDLSSVLYTHTQLVNVGVDARLHVWESMWHGFIYDPDLPESQEAYRTIARFFSRCLRTG